MIETGVLFGDIHSFYDLNLILSPFTPAPATPKTNFVEVAGADDPVDLTEALGKVNYNQRDFQFTFTINPADKMTFDEKVTQVSNALNGKRCKITLDRDAEYYWLGRCAVNAYKQDGRIGQVVIDAKVSPYKLKQKETVYKHKFPEGANGSVSGENIVQMSDVNQYQHELNVRVERKNLFDSNLFLAATGWTETDGVYAGLSSALYQKYKVDNGGFLPNFPFKENTQYTFSCSAYDVTENNNGSGTIFRFYYTDDTQVDLDIPHSAGFANYTMTSQAGKTVKAFCASYQYNGTAYIKDVQLEESVTATENAPYIGDLSTVVITRCGKNLFDKDNTSNLLDGYVSGAGAYTASKSGEKSFVFKCAPNTNYVVSKLFGKSHRVAGFATMPTGTTQGTLIGEYGNTTSFKFNSGTAKYIVVWYLNNSGETYTNEEMLNSIQLEIGTTATAYAQYVGTEHTTNTDGTVDGVLSIPQVTTLISDTDGVVITTVYITTGSEPQTITLRSGRKAVVPVFECTNDNTIVVFGNITETLSAGTHKILDICFTEGNNILQLFGSGTVTITYQEGEL